jgi:hypothetical protein
MRCERLQKSAFRSSFIVIVSKGRSMDITGIVAICSIFVLLPSIFVFASYMKRKNENELVKLKYQRDLLELEIRNNEAKANILELENKKYDNLIRDE